jgi:hypothetical protein
MSWLQNEREPWGGNPYVGGGPHLGFPPPLPSGDTVTLRGTEWAVSISGRRVLQGLKQVLEARLCARE